ncbi:MAG: NADPH-dependent FMN reductase [Gemmatimonadaceae bacterium]
MPDEPTTVLAISGSLRAQSTNTEVLLAASQLAPPSVVVHLLSGLGEVPAFNPDLDVQGMPLPALVQALRAQVGAADALLICSPEYAHGVPGVLKNALDWLVSGPEMPHKPVALLNVSPRSTHAQASLAETLRTMSATLVFPEAVPIVLPGRGLTAATLATDGAVAAQLREVLTALLRAVPVYRNFRRTMGI